MFQNHLKNKLDENKVVLGPFVKVGDPALVEIAGFAGFDFVIIDLEHGPHTIESTQNLVRAAAAVGLSPVIRVTQNEPTLILRALDIGAQGVQVPQISTKEAAEKVVKSAKYYPGGERGVCRYVRAANYSSMDKFEYFKSANSNTTIIAHIEGINGINNLESILKVKNIDIIFLGPYDLSQSCGVPGQVDHPDVQVKMTEAVKLASKYNKHVGTFVESVESAHKWMKLGVKYLSYSVDVGIYSQACKDIVSRFKEISL